MTENRTLFYYANQILHIENGVISPSDFALGSFESEFDEDEPEDELNANTSFVLNNDENKRDTNNEVSFEYKNKNLFL